MQKLLILFTLSLLLGLSACNNEPSPLVIPSAYDAAGFDAASQTEQDIRTRLSGLVGTMQAGRTQGTTVAVSNLEADFTTGTPSLKNLATAYYRGRINDNDGWLSNLARASGGSYSPGQTAGEGGVFSGYLFDENGIELEQLVEKGLYTAALYNHALSLMNGNMTDGSTDQLIAIWGAR
ncbi:MAG: hypothetical protein R3B47_09485 [Bacteroidia bacterium]